MAFELVVKFIGDASSLNKAYAQAAGNSKKFEQETAGSLTRVGVHVKGLGRTLLQYGGAYVGIRGIGEAFDAVVGAANDAAKAQRALEAQMQASGESFAAHSDQVEKASLSLEKYGITAEESEKGLAVLDRATGNIQKSIALQGGVADIAKAKNIDFAAAAAVVAKVFGGQETALRRAVPGLEKHAHGMDLIREAYAKVAGQAEANTTVFDKFHATLHNTEVIIGTALMPTIGKLLDRFTAWLDKMNQTGELQRDVNNAVQTATTVFTDLKNILEPLAGLFKTVGDAVGGTKNEVELLVGAFVALKVASIAGWVSSTVAGFAAVTTAAEATAAAEGEAAAGAAAARGTAALPALLTPPGLIAVAGAAGLYMQQGAQSAAAQVQKDTDRTFAPGSQLETTLVPRLAQQIAAMYAKGMKGPAIEAALRQELGGGRTGTAADLIAEAFQFRAGNASKLTDRIRSQIGNQAAQSVLQGVKLGVTDATLKVGRATPQQRNAAFDAAIQRQLGTVQDVQSVQGQIGLLQSIARELERRYAATKDITRRLTLEGRLTDVFRQIRDKRVQAQQNVIDAFQVPLARAALTKSLDDDIAVLQATNAKLEQQNKLYGVTRDRTLQIIQNQQTIQGYRQQEADQAKQAADAAKQAADATKQARQAAQQAVIDAFQVPIARAALTKTLDDDIAVLEAQNAKLAQQNRLYGVTKERTLEILQNQQTIQGYRQQETDNIKQAHDTAVQNTLGWMQLAIDRADLTTTTTDNLRAVDAYIAKLKQIRKKDGDSLSLEQDLLSHEQQRNQIIKDRADAAKQAAQTAAQATQNPYAKPFFDWLKWVYPGVGFRAPVGVNLTPRPGFGAAGGSVVINTVHVHGVQNARQLTDELVKIGRGQPHTRRGAS